MVVRMESENPMVRSHFLVENQRAPTCGWRTDTKIWWTTL